MKTKNINGYTIMEIITVMVIISVLSAMVIGAIIAARNNGKEAANRFNALEIQDAIEQYRSKTRSYPAETMIPANTDLIDAASALTTNLDLKSSCPDVAAGSSGDEYEGGGKVSMNYDYTDVDGNIYTYAYRIDIAKANCTEPITGDDPSAVDYDIDEDTEVILGPQL